MAGSIPITLARSFAVAPAIVHAAWLDPEVLGRFLFRTPAGELKAVEADPRVGGGFVVAEQRGAMLAEHFGVYEEIEPPHRLAFSYATSREGPRSPVRIDIASEAPGARLTLTHVIDGQWAAFEDPIRQSWTMILDRLASELRA